jgi:hypothetical protein
MLEVLFFALSDQRFCDLLAQILRRRSPGFASSKPGRTFLPREPDVVLRDGEQHLQCFRERKRERERERERGERERERERERKERGESALHQCIIDRAFDVVMCEA